MAAFGHSEEEMSTGSSNSTDADSPQRPKKTMDYFPTNSPRGPPLRSPLDWSFTTSDLDVSETSSLDGPGVLRQSQHRQSLQDQRAILKYSHITSEYVRLSEVLENMDPVEIKQNLQRRLVKNDPKAIVAMSILFPRTHFPYVHEVHCVRCHGSFNPRDNVNSKASQCRVPHPVELVISVGSDPQGVINYYCKGCRKGFKLARWCYDLDCDFKQTGVCFYGKHTTNPKEVAYRGAVRTCEDKGCVEYYV